MATRKYGKLLTVGLALVVLTTLAAVPLFAQGMGYGMGNGGMGGMMGGNLPAVDPATLPDRDSPGAQILQSRCIQCHGLPAPNQHSAQQWPGIVERMQQRMAMMAQRPMGMMRGDIQPLSNEEAATLLGYLQQNAAPAATRQNLPPKGGPGAGLFTRACSSCHALPDPASHSAAEWPTVVRRMEAKSGFGSLTQQQESVLLGYLQRNAGR